MSISFIPWLKEGLATQIIQKNGDLTPLLRPTVQAQVEVNGVASNTITKELNLLGSGDVLNINQASITKVEPKDGFRNYDYNYFPYVEFYDEFLPWRFTPAVADNNKLTPWIFLAVLAHGKDGNPDEFTRIEFTGKGLPAISVNTEYLPKEQNQLWAWAHAQTATSVETTVVDITTTPDINEKDQQESANLKALKNTNADAVISRLISPRLLEPNTTYTAFVLPTFELSRLAGLDLNLAPGIGGQKMAWTPPTPNGSPAPDVVFPIYYQWEFSTGDGGDFESLVRKLVPKAVNPDFGRRPVDFGSLAELLNNNGDLNSEKQLFTNESDQAVKYYYEGTLRAPQQGHVDFNPAVKNKFVELLNTGAKQQNIAVQPAVNTNVYGSSFANDPIITPTLYGKWHAAKDVVSAQVNWFNTLNVDPQYRIIAGLGTNVVREKQDIFMKYAWEQIGEVLAANKKIIQAQLAKQLLKRVSIKHYKSVENEEKLFNRTQAFQSKVRYDATTSFKSHIEQTRLPDSTTSFAFQRAIRTRGTLAKSLNNLAGLAGEAAVSSGLQKSIVTNLNNANESKVKLNIPQEELGIRIDETFVTAAAQAIANAPANSAAIIDVDRTENTFLRLAAEFDGADPIVPDSNLSQGKSAILNHINPDHTVTDIVTKKLAVENPMITVKYDEASQDIIPILAYPTINFPTYKYLSNTHIIQNISEVENNSITVLGMNRPFIESYMVGLNHEFSKELLWRGYPTDQRGTSFRNFWHAGDNLTRVITQDNSDISPIHEWGNSTLGQNYPSDNTMYQPGTTGDKLVLVIRGDLLRKFPNAVIYAVKANWQGDILALDRKHVPQTIAPDLSNVKFPTFNSFVAPDVYLIGFDLTAVQAKGDDNIDGGWFFVISERPGETRFGLDIGTQGGTWNNSAISDWDDLTRNHFTRNDNGTMNNDKYVNLTRKSDQTIQSITWNADSAQQAHILSQKPVIVFIHALNCIS